MNADTDHIPGVNTIEVEELESFITDFRIAKRRRRRGREHIQPTRGDYRSSEGGVAWIDKMDFHERPDEGHLILAVAAILCTVAVRGFVRQRSELLRRKETQGVEDLRISGHELGGHGDARFQHT